MEEVERIEPDWQLAIGYDPDADPPINGFNAHAYYTLRELGDYRVKVRIPIRNYLAHVIQEIRGVEYAPLADVDWSGYLESATLAFTLVQSRRPVALQMQYSGEDCSASSNSQDPANVDCKDSGSLPPPDSGVTLYITAANKKNLKTANIYLDLVSFVLSDTDKIWIDAESIGLDRLDGQTYIWIYSDEAGKNLLQTVVFHTSASDPLYYGDQFGSWALVGFKPQK